MLNIQGDIQNIKKLNSRRKEVIGSWESSGGRNIGSFRNDHFLFNVPSDNTYIDVIIQSGVDNYLYVINSLGFIVSETDSDRLVSNLKSGTYRLVVATFASARDSNYILNVVGQYENLQEKPSNTIETIGAWVASGGRDINSPNNPKYSFEVTEESLVDITITSSIDNYLYLVDNLGLIIAQTDSDRLTAKISEGQYKVIAATFATGQASNFVLNINGQIKNFFEN